MTTTAAAKPPIPRWRAFDSAGVGHAVLRGALRTVCGKPTQPEAYDWPRRSKCQLCVKALTGTD